jgi:hypothetical protein
MLKSKVFLKSSCWIIVMILFSSGLFSQTRGNGNVVQNQRNVPAFSGIVVKSGIDLSVMPGDKSSLEIEADENLQQYIISEVKDNVLYVYVEKHRNIWNSRSMNAKVMVKDLNSINVSGGGDVESGGTIRTDDLKIGISGGGDLEFDLEAKKTSCSVSGGGDVELKGEINDLIINISGGGDLELKANVGMLDVTVSGGGDAEISGGKKASNVRVKMNGGGDLEMNIGCRTLFTEMGGGGDAEIKAGEQVEKAKLVVSSGGELDLKIVTQKLELSMSGGGDASLSGATENFSAKVKSGGDLFADGFRAKIADLKLSGGSEAKVQVSEKLTITASGGGQIYVSGDPQINANLSGGSKVHQKQ